MSTDSGHGQASFDAGVWTYDRFTPAEQIWRNGARVASALDRLGVRAGSTVALLLRNDHAFIEASFGASALGANPLPVNWHSAPDEIAYVLDDSKAEVVIGHTDLLRGASTAIEALPVIAVPTPPSVIDRYGLDEHAADVSTGAIVWDDWLDGMPAWRGSRPELPFSIVYTSGTTGRPKGVRRMAPQDDHAEATRSLIEERKKIMGFRSGMRSVVAGPMYHSAPNAWGLGSVSSDGFVALQPRFDAEELLQLIERHRITHLSVVPTMFVRLLKLGRATRRRYDLSSLEHVVHGAAPCPVEVKRAMIDWWGPIIWEYYGGTETGLVTACNSEEWLAHLGTVGRPLSVATVRIYADDGSELPAGERGEVFMRSAGMPDFTYEGRESERLECEQDGLITCGDVGYLDDDGFLHLCDRKRDMVISGGVNIYPAEIEACLLEMVEVRDAAVFGIPHEEYGESLAAAIELEPGSVLTDTAVEAHVRSALAGFKVPRLVTFHEHLPREDSGKIFKRKLREPYWAETGRAI